MKIILNFLRTRNRILLLLALFVFLLIPQVAFANYYYHVNIGHTGCGIGFDLSCTAPGLAYDSTGTALPVGSFVQIIESSDLVYSTPNSAGLIPVGDDDRIIFTTTVGSDLVYFFLVPNTPGQYYDQSIDIDVGALPVTRYVYARIWNGTTPGIGVKYGNSAMRQPTVVVDTIPGVFNDFELDATYASFEVSAAPINIVHTTPASLESNVTITTNMTVEFDTDLTLASLEVGVLDGNLLVSGTKSKNLPIGNWGTANGYTYEAGSGGKVIKFNNSNFKYNETLTATVDSFSIGSADFTGPYTWIFTTESCFLQVVQATPSSETGVAVTTSPTVEFDGSLPAIFSSAYIAVTDDKGKVYSSFTSLTREAANDKVLLIDPTDPFNANSLITVTIEAFENDMGCEYNGTFTFTFETAAGIFYVIKTDPSTGETIATLTTPVTFEVDLELSGAINPGTTAITSPLGPIDVASIYIVDSSTGISTLEIDHSALPPGKTITVTIAALSDAGGNSQGAPHTFTFETEAVQFNVVRTDPDDGDNGIVVTAPVTFDVDAWIGPIDSSTIYITSPFGIINADTLSILLAGPGRTTLEITHATDFPPGQTITVTIAALSDGSNSLAAPYTFTFETAGAPFNVVKSDPSTGETIASLTSPITFETDLRIGALTTYGTSVMTSPLGPISINAINLLSSATGVTTFEIDHSILPPGKTITLTLEGLQDGGGNYQANTYTVTFETAAYNFYVVRTDPASGETGVSISAPVTFDVDALIGPTLSSTIYMTSPLGEITVNGLSLLSSSTGRTTLEIDHTDFPAGQTITVTIAALSDGANTLAAPYTFTFETSAIQFNVVRTDPNTGETGVVVTAPITFDVDAFLGDVTSSTIYITSPYGPITADTATILSATSGKSTLEVKHTENFPPGVTMTVTIAALEDGPNSLEKPYTFTFKTAGAPFNVVRSDPSTAETIATLTAPITFETDLRIGTLVAPYVSTVMTSPLGPISISSIDLLSSATGVTTFEIDHAILPPGKVITLTIEGLVDTGGNYQAGSYTVTFETAAVQFYVVRTDPASGETGVAISAPVIFDVDALIGPNPLSTWEVNMTSALGPIAVSNVSIISGVIGRSTLEIDPTLNLPAGQTITVTIAALSDGANTLAAPYTFTFETEAVFMNIVRTTPSTGDVDVSITEIPTVEFDHTLASTPPAISVFGSVSGPITGLTYYIDPIDPHVVRIEHPDFAYKETITVTVAAFTDPVTGYELASPYTFSFETSVINFIVTSSDPSTGETISSLTAPVTFEVDQPIGIISSIPGLTAMTSPFGTINIFSIDWIGIAGGVTTFKIEHAILPPGKVITLTIEGLADVGGNTQLGSYTVTFETPAVQFNVVRTDPNTGETVSAANLSANLTFDVDALIGPSLSTWEVKMSSALGSISVSNVLLKSGVNGRSTLEIDPVLTLPAGQTITVTISALSDGANTLAAPYTFTFETEAIFLTIVRTDPNTGETGVAVNKSPSVEVNLPLSDYPPIIDLSSNRRGAISKSVTLLSDPKVFEIDPSTDFKPGEIITVNIAAFTDPVTGYRLADPYTFSFTVETVQFIVVRSDPYTGETNVALTRPITFDVNAWIGSLDGADINISSPAGNISPDLIKILAFGPGRTTLEIDHPSTPFPPGQVITVTIANMEDIDHNTQAATYTFTFETTPYQFHVIRSDPATGETGVALTDPITFDVDAWIGPPTSYTINISTSLGTIAATALDIISSGPGVSTFEIAHSEAFPPGKTVTVTIAAINDGPNHLAEPYTFSFETAAVQFNVVRTDPNTGETGVSVTDPVTFDVDALIGPLLSTWEVTMTSPLGPINVSDVSWISGVTGRSTLEIAHDLFPAGQTITATISALSDGANSLAAPYTFTFETESVFLNIVKTTPSTGAVDVSITETPTVEFNYTLTATPPAITVFGSVSGPIIPVSISLDSNKHVVIIDTPDFKYSETITVTVAAFTDPGTGYELAAPYTFTFETSAILFNVVRSDPYTGEPDVALTAPITFDVDADVSFIDSSNIIISSPFGIISHANPTVLFFSADRSTIEVVPDTSFPPGQVITVTIEALQSGKNRLQNPYTFTFETAAVQFNVVRTDPNTGETVSAANLTSNLTFDVDALIGPSLSTWEVKMSSPLGPINVSDVIWKSGVIGRSTLEIDPTLALPAGQTITATISALSDGANTLAAPYTFTFETEAVFLTIVRTDPSTGDVDVPIDKSPSAEVDYPLYTPPTVIITGTSSGTIPADVSVVGDPYVIDIDPTKDFRPGETITATIPAFTDPVTGYTLRDPYTFSFDVETVEVIVVRSDPATGETGVAITAPVTFDVDAWLTAPTISTVNISSPLGPITTISVNLLSAGPGRSTFEVAHADFPPGQTITVTVAAVDDAAGNTLAAPYTFTFETAAATFNVVRTDPTTGDVNVSVTDPISFEVDLELGPITDWGTTSITSPFGPVDIYSIDLISATTGVSTLDIKHAELPPGQTITVTIAALVDSGNNTQAAPYTFTFETAAVQFNVVRTDPNTGETGVAVTASVTFDVDALIGPSISTWEVKMSSPLGPISVSNVLLKSGVIGRSTLEIDPAISLPAGQTITVTISALSDGANTLAAPHTFTFETEAVFLTIVRTDPSTGDVSVSVSKSPSAEVDYPLYTPPTVIITGTSSGTIPAVVSVTDPYIIAIDPTKDFRPGETITATIPAFTDPVTGYTLRDPYTFTFDIETVEVNVVRSDPVTGETGVVVTAPVTFDVDAWIGPVIDSYTIDISSPLGSISVTTLEILAAGPGRSTLEVGHTTPFPAGQTITVTIAALSSDGNTLANPYTFTFETAAVQFNVVRTDPNTGETVAAANLTSNLTFDVDALIGPSISTWEVKMTSPLGLINVSNVVWKSGVIGRSTLEIDPTLALPAGQTITATISALSDGANTLAAPYTFTFETEAVFLTIVRTDPSTGDVSVPIDKSPSAEVDYPLYTPPTVIITGTSSGTIPAVVNVTDPYIIAIDPTKDFRPGETITATIPAFTDPTTGYTLRDPYTFSFDIETVEVNVVRSDPATGEIDVVVTAPVTFDVDAWIGPDIDSYTIDISSPLGSISVTTLEILAAGPGRSTLEVGHTTPFPAGQTITVTIAALSSDGNTLASPYTFYFETEPVQFNVIRTDPATGETGVALTDPITFDVDAFIGPITSYTIDISTSLGTISATAVDLLSSGPGVSTFEIAHTEAFPPGKTVTVTVAALSSGTNTLAEPYTFTFETAAVQFYVVRTDPISGETNVAIDRPITFDVDALIGPNISTWEVNITSALGPVNVSNVLWKSGVIGRSTLEIAHADFPAGQVMTVTIEALSDGANTLASPYTFTFETAACIISVVQTYPMNAAIGVDQNTNVTVEVDTNIVFGDLTNIRLTGSKSGTIGGSGVTVDANRIINFHNNPFGPKEVITATVEAFTASSGCSMPTNYTFTFETASCYFNVVRSIPTTADVISRGDTKIITFEVDRAITTLPIAGNIPVTSSKTSGLLPITSIARIGSAPSYTFEVTMTNDFKAGEVVTVTLEVFNDTAGTGCDLANPYSFTFEVNPIYIVIVDTTPNSFETGVARTINITAEANIDVSGAIGIIDSYLKVVGSESGLKSVGAIITTKTIDFQNTPDFYGGETVTATIEPFVDPVTGAELQNPYTWIFTIESCQISVVQTYPLTAAAVSRTTKVTAEVDKNLSGSFPINSVLKLTGTRSGIVTLTTPSYAGGLINFNNLSDFHSLGEIITATIESFTDEGCLFITYTWTFEVLAEVCTVEVISTSPVSNETGVSILKNVVITFDSDITNANLPAFYNNMKLSGSESGLFSFDTSHYPTAETGTGKVYLNNVGIQPFIAGETVFATIESFTNGDGCQFYGPYTWTFTVEVCTIEVVRTYPVSDEIDVLVNANVTVEFSSTLTTTEGIPLAMTGNKGFVYNSTTTPPTFDPATNILSFNNGIFDLAETVTVTIESFTDGCKFYGPYTWVFSTEVTCIVTGELISRVGTSINSGVSIEWSTTGCPVDIYTISGEVTTDVFTTEGTSWTREATAVSGTTYTDPNQVRIGTQKYYKIVPTGTSVGAIDFSTNILGKFDLTASEGYNLVSNPLIPIGSMNVNDIIGNQLVGNTFPGSASRIYTQKIPGTGFNEAYLSSSDNRWKDTLTNLDSTMTLTPEAGFWIHIPTGVSTSYVTTVGRVRELSSIKYIRTLYNLWGNPYPISIPLNTSNLAVSGASYGTINGAIRVYDFRENKIGFYEAYANTQTVWRDSFTNQITTMKLKPGKGYWIYEPYTSPGFFWNLPRPY